MRISDQTKKLLSWLAEGPVVISVIGLTILTSPYNASIRMMMKRADEIRDGKISPEDKKVMEKNRRKLSNLIYHLKKQGLIIKKDNKYAITSKGEKALAKIKEAFVPRRNYTSQKDDTLKIIAFDIPEPMRNKRDWLRESLKQMKFKMLQRSVWYGKAKIPQEFLEDLDELNLSEYVDVLAITKTGSLRQI